MKEAYTLSKLNPQWKFNSIKMIIKVKRCIVKIKEEMVFLRYNLQSNSINLVVKSKNIRKIFLKIHS